MSNTLQKIAMSEEDNTKNAYAILESFVLGPHALHVLQATVAAHEPRHEPTKPNTIVLDQGCCLFKMCGAK